MAFAQWLRVRRMISEIALEPKQTFWNMTANLLLDAAILEWAKVFGSWDEDTHWTKVIPVAQHDATRAEMLQFLGLTPQEWEEQHASLLNYRNQLVAHHDLDAAVTTVPYFDTALTAAFFMFDRIRALADQDWLGNVPTDLDQWSNNVAGNMSAIVRKAHAASATLGSNVRS